VIMPPAARWVRYHARWAACNSGVLVSASARWLAAPAKNPPPRLTLALGSLYLTAGILRLRLTARAFAVVAHVIGVLMIALPAVVVVGLGIAAWDARRSRRP